MTQVKAVSSRNVTMCAKRKATALRTILASLNETTNNEAVIATAAFLGREFNATIRGQYVIPAARIYPSAYYEPIPDMFEAHRRYFEDQSKSVTGAFNAAFAGSSLRFDLRIENSGSPLICDSVIEFGRACDLVLVSQTEMALNKGVELDFVPRVAIGAGRPVLVVPRESALRSVPKTIVVGWNGSREAARAAFDSLPFLQRAKAVHLIWIDPPAERREVLPAADLVRSLTLEGVNASLDPVPSQGRDPGEVLLKRAQALGAGLVVIGAYGHSRLSEFILGGVTRTVLRQMRCPVLLSH